MLKKILIYTGVSIVLLAIGAYFYFATMLYKQQSAKQVCRVMKVQLLDSAQNRFVSQKEVIGIIDGFMGKTVGKKVSEIDLNLIEELLNKRSAIKVSQVSITRDGKMNIDITQRKPILRIQTDNGGFYVDQTKYIFPLVESFTSYVPIVSGNIPFVLNAGHRGLAMEDKDDWMSKILELGNYLNSNSFWNSQIEQIYIGNNGDVFLAPRVGDHVIIFGDLNDIQAKFDKLYAFYKNIIPNRGWEKYSAVNLKYKNQIVCKLKNNKQYKSL